MAVAGLLAGCSAGSSPEIAPLVPSTTTSPTGSVADLAPAAPVARRTKGTGAARVRKACGKAESTLDQVVRDLTARAANDNAAAARIFRAGAAELRHQGDDTSVEPEVRALATTMDKISRGLDDGTDDGSDTLELPKAAEPLSRACEEAGFTS